MRIFLRDVSQREPSSYLLCLASQLASAGRSGLVIRYANACQPCGGTKEGLGPNSANPEDIGSVDSSPGEGKMLLLYVTSRSKKLDAT